MGEGNRYGEGVRSSKTGGGEEGIILRGEDRRGGEGTSIALGEKRASQAGQRKGNDDPGEGKVNAEKEQEPEGHYIGYDHGGRNRGGPT